MILGNLIDRNVRHNKWTIIWCMLMFIYNDIFLFIEFHHFLEIILNCINDCWIKIESTCVRRRDVFFHSFSIQEGKKKIYRINDDVYQRLIYVHTRAHTHTHTHTHTHHTTHAHTYTHTHTYTRIHTHTHTNTHIDTHTHWHTHTLSLTHIYTTHADAHTHAHMYTFKWRCSHRMLNIRSQLTKQEG